MGSEVVEKTFRLECDECAHAVEQRAKNASEAVSETEFREKVNGGLLCSICYAIKEAPENPGLFSQMVRELMPRENDARARLSRAKTKSRDVDTDKTKTGPGTEN